MGERSGEDGLLAQAEVAPLTGLAESLGIDRSKWIQVATKPLPETLRLTMHHYDIEWTRKQLIAMGATPLKWSIGNEAYQLPFARGQAPRDGTRELLALLHDTGRVTRQEAASMLPILVLNPQPNELLLDLCAAPGSKATHAAERMAPTGVVVANEPISGRVNMLASNRGRLSLHNVMITQHDGRHVGRIPKPGFDAIVADVPCTGSATSRKNKDVWWRWSPKGGRTMFQLQVDIASRGAQLLRPGGTMVYSTCLIDPVENEAVIAELIQKCPWMDVIEIDESNVDGLVWHQGLSAWSPLDEQGIVSQRPQDVPFFDERYLPPSDGAILDALSKTRRLYPQDNNTGGFIEKMQPPRVLRERSSINWQNDGKNQDGNQDLSRHQNQTGTPFMAQRKRRLRLLCNSADWTMLTIHGGSEENEWQLLLRWFTTVYGLKKRPISVAIDGRKGPFTHSKFSTLVFQRLFQRTETGGLDKSLFRCFTINYLKTCLTSMRMFCCVSSEVKHWNPRLFLPMKRHQKEPFC